MEINNNNNASDGGNDNASSAGSIFPPSCKGTNVASAEGTVASHALCEYSTGTLTTHVHSVGQHIGTAQSLQTMTRNNQLWRPHPFDIPYGLSNHSGNRHFNTLLDKEVTVYSIAQKGNSKQLKRSIADRIIREVEAKGGQFLEQIPPDHKPWLPHPPMSKDKRYQKIHNRMIVRLRRFGQKNKNQKKRPPPARTYPPTRKVAKVERILGPTQCHPTPKEAAVFSPQKQRRTVSTRFQAAVKAGIRQAMLPQESNVSSNARGRTGRQHITRCGESDISHTSERSTNNDLEGETYVDLSAATSSMDRCDDIEEEVSENTVPGKNIKENPSTGAGTDTETSETGHLSSHFSTTESSSSQSSSVSLQTPSKDSFAEEADSPRTLSTNRMSFDTSGFSSISTIPSLRRNESRRVVEGLFLSPSLAPSKSPESCCEAVTHNVAKANLLCFPSGQLLSPGIDSEWNSFRSAPRSPMLDNSFDSGLHDLSDPFLRPSPGFSQSPIGWPDVVGASDVEEGAGSLTRSLMKGMMIQSPTLGPYPSPSATMRHVSGVTSSLKVSISQSHTVRRDESLTSIYEMGQSQCFTWKSEDSTKDNHLNSLRIDLSSIYSDSSLSAALTLDDAKVPSTMTILSPIDRHVFDCATPIKDLEFTSDESGGSENGMNVKFDLPGDSTAVPMKW